MERLTVAGETQKRFDKFKQSEAKLGLKNTRTNALKYIVNKLAYYLGIYEDTGLTPAEVADLSKAKQERRMVVLPCKVGTQLYGLTLDRKAIVPFIADEFIWSNGHWFIMGTHGEGDFDERDCFTTREAAESEKERRERDG